MVLINLCLCLEAEQEKYGIEKWKVNGKLDAYIQ
jgi:hypothetical protein